MPRKYIRISNRQNWSEENMAKAIDEVIQGNISYKKASFAYDFPQSTLEDRVKKANIGASVEVAARKGMGNFKCVFTENQERELVQHIKFMEIRLFGLTTKDVRRLAYELAEKNGLKHNFNLEEKLAGPDWQSGFMKRHPDLSLRKPEATSAARAMGFNKTAVSKFYEILASCFETYKFQPGRIYNVDETGLTSVPKTQSKVLAQKGRRQVGALTSAERGQLVMAELCFSAAGHYVPPLLIFPRIRMKEELIESAPPGTIAICHPSGWMQAEIFLEWMQHFISNVKPSKDEPVLLLLDGHATHVKNLAVIDIARDNGIIILCFPPHCTHKLQPLDVSFMAPLSTFYGQEVTTWLLNHPGRVVTQYQIAKLFGLAYIRAATMQNAISGFQKTGIYPLNPNTFGEEAYAPADTTERTAEKESVNPETDCESQPGPPCEPQPGPTCEPQPGHSYEPQPGQSGLAVTPKKVSYNFSVSPQDVIPIPHCERSFSNKRRGKTSIITSSPYRNELREMQRGPANKQVKRKLLTKPRNLKQEQSRHSSSSDENKNETPCLLCKEPYSSTNKTDEWVRCLKCQKWAHESCTGWDKNELDEFVCVPCLRSKK